MIRRNFSSTLCNGGPLSNGETSCYSSHSEEQSHGFRLSALITPAFITAAAGGLGKLAQNLLNHKSTENFEKQTTELKAVIQQGNAELKGVISSGNEALVSAIKGLKQ
jgi:hypothetical protein